MTTKYKPTLDDVAREAGVSKSSISMILSEKEGVSFSKETIDTVLKAAAKVGYVRKKTKFSKSAVGKLNTLLILTPSSTNPYCSAIIHSIEKQATERNLKLVIRDTLPLGEIDKKDILQFKESTIYGIISLMAPINPQLLEEINLSVPVVVISDHGPKLNLDTIEFNNYEAGEQVAKYMILLGHKNAAYITPELEIPSLGLDQRQQAMEDSYLALAGGSLNVKKVKVYGQNPLGNRDLMYSIGYDMTLKTIEDKAITGIILANDLIAYGVIDALHDKNLSIPQDMSVIGFDNIFPSQFKIISLTSMDHHLDQKGSSAVEMIASRHEQKLSHVGYRRVVLNHNLVIRRSTAHARTLEKKILA